MSAAKDFLEELELFGKSWNYIYSTKATLRDFARSCISEKATEFDVDLPVVMEKFRALRVYCLLFSTNSIQVEIVFY